MCIAQEILDNYFQLKQSLMKARKEYLKKKVKEEKEEQYRLSLNAPKFRVSNSELILARKKQNLLKSSKDIQQMASDHYAYFKAKRKEEKQAGKRPATARGFSSHTRDPDDYTSFTSSLYGRMTKKQYLHTLHPTSKLILDKRKFEEEENGVKYKYPVEVDKVERKFRLKQTHSQGLIKKRNFVASMSTGPLERRSKFVGGIYEVSVYLRDGQGSYNHTTICSWLHRQKQLQVWCQKMVNAG